jgi:hypothetical protein
MFLTNGIATSFPLPAPHERDASAKRARKINVAYIFNKLSQIDILSEKIPRPRCNQWEMSGKKVGKTTFILQAGETQPQQSGDLRGKTGNRKLETGNWKLETENRFYFGIHKTGHGSSRTTFSAVEPKKTSSIFPRPFLPEPPTTTRSATRSRARTAIS